LGAFSNLTKHKEISPDYIANYDMREKHGDIKNMIDNKVKGFYLSKGIDSNRISSYKDPVYKNSPLYYNTVYNKIKQETYDEVNKLRNFDLVKNLSLYATQVFNYKVKSENADEIGLYSNIINDRYKQVGIESKYGHEIEDINGKKVGTLENRIKQFNNTLDNFRGISTNRPFIGLKKSKWYYTSLEKVQLKELEKYRDTLINRLNSIKASNNGDITEQDEILENNIQKEIDKVNQDIEKLGNDVYWSDVIIKPLIMLTQLKGLGFNFMSYFNNVAIGQLFNYYQAIDGRLFSVKNFMETLSDFGKNSEGVHFGMGISGLVTGFVLTNSFLLGGGAGFIAGRLLADLIKKRYKGSDSQIRTEKVENIIRNNDLMNKVQNESYKPFSVSNPNNPKISKFLSSPIGKYISNNFSLYKATESGEEFNQGVIVGSYLKSVKI
ncbi:MAG: hypothetical protein KC414_14100, partial [Romboutsia sp.]|nr:hypothetical protein [Romboutsia sp.]